LFALAGRPGANDPDQAFFWFRVDDDHDPAIDRTDRDEAVFGFRVLRVEYIQVVGTGFEEPSSLGKRQSVLLLIAEVLRIVPFELDDLTG
jgi:hypothetical protein